MTIHVCNLSWDAHSFQPLLLHVIFHTRVGAEAPEGSTQNLWMEPAQTQNRIRMQQGQPLLAVLEATHRERLGTLTGTKTNSVQALTHAEYLFSSSCSNRTPLWVKCARDEKEESTHLEGMEPARSQTSGLLLWKCGTRSRVNGEVLASEQRKSPSSTRLWL